MGALRLTLTFILFCLISCSSVLSHADNKCASKAMLKNYAGHYAEKRAWETLPKIKIWSDVSFSLVSAVDISDSGEAGASFGWHEGGDCCVQIRGSELWVKNPSEDKADTKWLGPYIRVSSQNDPYFNRIFGTRCFKSNKSEQWCFGPGFIRVGTKQYTASVFTDTSEMPTYGTPVQLLGEKDFWVFVPWGEGWKVFKDSFLTDPDNRNIDPKKTTPWRKLSP